MSKERQPILSVENITKSFGGLVAVEGLSFDLYQGEVLGIIGPNGSGKTTCINCMSGFIKPNVGEIRFKGRDITGLAPYKIAQMGIGRTFQVMRPFYTLPSFKNLIVPLFSPRAKKFLGGGRLGDRDAIAIDILEAVGFERDARVPYKTAGALSLGYLKRLELARCIALRSEVMLLDEVLAGLSMSEIASMVPLLVRLKMEGATIMMVEHRLRELFQIADRVIVMHFGQKIFDGSSSAAMKDERVTEAYFGKKGEIKL